VSQPYVHGPAQIFVSTGGADASPTYEFLGWSKGPVAPEFDGLHVDENIDFSGMVPFDVSFQGELAVVAMQLKRFNWAVFEKVACRIRGATRGTIPACGIGTLLNYEKKGFGLIIKGPYASCKSAFYSGMPVDMRFPFAYVAGPYSEPMSTRAVEIPITFRCIPIIDPTTNSGTLFDTDMTAISGVSLN